MLNLVLIRHGQTAGNLRHNYIGRTDEPLCEQGRQNLRQKLADGIYPPVQQVFCSPMLRCRQTAALLYPHLAPQIIDDLRECDFGDFENLNYQDLSGNPAYQAWIGSNGTLPFPGGESREQFAARCVRGFEQIAADLLAQDVTDAMNAALVVHGGTIMALLSAFTDGDYYDFACDNGGGWQVSLDEQIWAARRRFAAWQPLIK